MKKLTMTKHNHLTKSASKPIKTKPTKAPVPAKPKQIKPKPTQPIKVPAKNIAPKTSAKASKATTGPQQAPQLQLSDFKLQTSVDNIGIQITTTYLGNAIHRFTLPVADYAGWQRMTMQQKHMYVRARTFVNAFENDLRIIQTWYSLLFRYWIICLQELRRQNKHRNLTGRYFSITGSP